MAVPSTAAAWPLNAFGSKATERVLSCAALVVFLGVAAQVATALFARHELSQVESIVAIHSRMLSEGEGIYYDLSRYPFTVSPYGPVFYSLSALLQSLGVAPSIAGRLISISALVVVWWLCYRLVWLHTSDRAASWTAVLFLASTANVLQWGTVGQVDTLALCFSLAGLFSYSRFESDGNRTQLVWCATWILLALLTKQSFLAAGVTVAVLALVRNPRGGVSFVAALSLIGAAAALALNFSTQGRFFDNTVLANLNPYRWEKLAQHLRYFWPTAGNLLFIAAAGWWARPRAGLTLIVYPGIAAAVLLLTAPKVGSDLNYQVETVTALCLAAGCALHRLDFFPLWQRRDPGWIPLLQLPLALHLVLNLSLTAKTVVERGLLEQARRQEASLLQPYFAPAGKRILSVQMDPLVQNHYPMQVEPLIYTLLVKEGVVDPEPVRADLAHGRFDLVLLYEDVFALPQAPKDSEIPSLPEAHLEEIRRNYELVRHLPGPLLDGDYLYEPIRR